MNVIGLTVSLRYFSSQQDINPSEMAMEVSAKASAVLTSFEWFVRQAMAAISILCPSGVIFLVSNDACPLWSITKGLSSQNVAMFLRLSFNSADKLNNLIASLKNKLFFEVS